MIKRNKLVNTGEEPEVDPAGELDATFTQEGNENVDTEQDIADQEAAGVTTPVASQAAGNGSNNPRTVSPKAQYNNLKKKVFGLGQTLGGSKTSMISLAETVTEAAQDGSITIEQVPEIYEKFKEGVARASTYEDAGEVSDEAAMGMAPAKSIEQQLSKLKRFVILGGKYETDALDLVCRARNMHIGLLRSTEGSAEAKKGIKPGSTYSVLIDVARAQLEKHKQMLETNKAAGVKSSGLAPVLTDDELRALMTQEVKEAVDKTGEDYLLDTLNRAKATQRGSDKRNAITSQELQNAIDWLRQALSIAAPELLAKQEAEDLAYTQAKAKAREDKAEAERLKAEKAAQPKLTKAERQAALNPDVAAFRQMTASVA